MGVEPNTVNDKMLYTPIDLHVLETFAIHGNLDVSDTNLTFPDEVLTTKATDEEAIEASSDEVVMTPAKVAVRDEKYDARRSGVDTAATAAENGTFLQNAVDLVKVTDGGKLLIPKGTYNYDNTLTLDNTYYSVEGDDGRGTILRYSGTGTAVEVIGENDITVKNLGIERNGTASHGLVLGEAAQIGWRYKVDNVDIRGGFSTAGLHAANCEQLSCERVFSYQNQIGFLIDNSAGASTGMANRFVLCRAQSSAAEGWWVDDQIAPVFFCCESLNNGATYQFRVVYAYRAIIDGLDVEDTTNALTKTGLRFVGEYSEMSIAGYGLALGIEIGSSLGCVLRPSRFSSTTKPISDIGSCTALLVFDMGNLGTSTFASSSDEVHYVGNQVRTEKFLVTGLAGQGFYRYVAKQTSDPAAPATGAVTFIRDSGGKTQLCVRFPTGAIQVLSTEP